MNGVIAGWIVITTVIQTVILFASDFQFTWCWLNPRVIYEGVEVNRFGCFVLTILAHIAAGPIYAFFYWFYKLCTVGRDEEDRKRENRIY